MGTIKNIADEAAETITECFKRLDQLNEELRKLEPASLDCAKKRFANESTAAFSMFTPHEDIVNKLALH